MPGTRAGGAKVALVIKKKYGEDFYKRIGQKGGRVLTDKPKGFAANRELAKIAGSRGGHISRRGVSKK